MSEASGANQQAFSFELNGAAVEVEAWPMARLLDVLREALRQTGTKEGCGEGECGACSVLVDGVLVNSCLVPMAQVQGAAITTIEGLAASELSAALRHAFVDKNGAQCGICTPGMLLAAYTLLQKHPDPSDAQIRDGLAGNLCRCTGYMKIFDAVRAAASEMEAGR